MFFIYSLYRSFLAQILIYKYFLPGLWPFILLTVFFTEDKFLL